MLMIMDMWHLGFTIARTRLIFLNNTVTTTAATVTVVAESSSTARAASGTIRWAGTVDIAIRERRQAAEKNRENGTNFANGD